MQWKQIQFFFSVCLLFASFKLDYCSHNTDFANWIEFPGNPIYAPYLAASLFDDYYPFVIYNTHKFNGNGARFFYKMWHQGPSGISLSYSSDGIKWILVGDVVTDSTLPFTVPTHASVIYDKHGFGGTPYHYKMWYWTGNLTISPPNLAIKFTQSIDGISWTTPVPTTQDAAFFLADVAQPGQPFNLFFGFGTVIYNPHATSIPGQPFTFPYVVFFDSGAGEQSPQTTQQAIGLAYSNDGINWIRFGLSPVLVPSGHTTDWDGKFAYRASVLKLGGIYHMYYSGSSGINNPTPITFGYTFGIGHASSTDGVYWTKNPDNPIFTVNDPNALWRSGRTLAPSVTKSHGIKMQMWFSGGTNSGPSFASAGIGLATLERMWIK